MFAEISENTQLVSVLVRSMDRASLPEALASVAAQSYDSIEVVLINAKKGEHSNVGTWCGRFPLRLINSEVGLTRVAAANTGLEHAQGTYLMFLDDDDLIDVEHISSLVSTLKKSTNCKAAFSGTRVTDAEGVTVGVYQHTYSPQQLLIGNFLPIHAVLFKKEMVEAGCRFDNALETYEDWDFWLQMSQKTDFVASGRVSAIYRSFLGDSGMSSVDDRPLQRQRRSMVWRKWWPAWNVDNLDLFASDMEEALEKKSKECIGFLNAFNFEVAQNSQLHHSLDEQIQHVSRLSHAVAELDISLAQLKTTLANRESVLANREMQITVLNTNIQDMLLSTSWRITAPIRRVRQWAGVLQRKIKAAALLAQLAWTFLKRGSIATQAGSAYRFVRLEGWSGIKQRLTRAAPSSTAFESQMPSLALESSQAIRLQRHDHQQLASIDIDRYKYFFFDVFDTAIIRLFEKPVDLFKYVGFITRSSKFENLRIDQERKTREKHVGRKDVKSEEIYRDFRGADQLSETSAELTFCVAHPETLAFYADLVAKGKKIYFVSDMYLDRATVAAILHKNGFNHYENIFVSSEDDFIKGDGSRFTWLKSTIPDSVGKTIHIGDNHISDFAQPRRHGYDAFHFTASIDFYRHDEFLFSKAPYLIAQNSLGVSFLLGMFRYWKSGAFTEQPGYWRQFGFFYGGALVSAFCGFINSTVVKKKLSTSRVFFLARDGDIMSQVCRLLFPNLEAVYLLASRRCMSFPSLRTMNPVDDEDMLKLFTTPIGVTCASDLNERLGYDDLNPLKEAFDELESRGLLKDEPAIVNCFIDHKSLLLAKADAERTTLLQYLGSVNFFENTDIVIADVGWGGTIQNALIKLIDHSDHPDRKLHGLYLGVSDRVAHRDLKTGFLFDGDKTRFVGFLNLIELITSSPKDGVVRIAEIDGDFLPVSGKSNAEESYRQSIAAEIQGGILEFAQLLKDKDIGDLDFLQPNDFEALFEALQDHPSEDDVEHLGKVRHAMTLGSHFGEKVLNKKG